MQLASAQPEWPSTPSKSSHLMRMIDPKSEPWSASQQRHITTHARDMGLIDRRRKRVSRSEGLFCAAFNVRALQVQGTTPSSTAKTRVNKSLRRARRSKEAAGHFILTDPYPPAPETRKVIRRHTTCGTRSKQQSTLP